MVTKNNNDWIHILYFKIHANCKDTIYGVRNQRIHMQRGCRAKHNIYLLFYGRFLNLPYK